MKLWEILFWAIVALGATVGFRALIVGGTL